MAMIDKLIDVQTTLPDNILMLIKCYDFFSGNFYFKELKPKVFTLLCKPSRFFFMQKLMYLYIRIDIYVNYNRWLDILYLYNHRKQLPSSRADSWMKFNFLLFCFIKICIFIYWRYLHIGYLKEHQCKLRISM